MMTPLAAADMALPINSLDAYVAQVQSFPLLTQQEETDYAEQLQNKSDLEAARQLVLSHLRFVVKIARGYRGYGLPMGDLIQEGNLGLMKAVKRFNPSLGVRLVSFAVYWIKSEIHEFILRNWRIVKVATTKGQRKLFFNFNRLKQKVKRHLQWFTAEEAADVAKTLGVTTQEVFEMERRLQNNTELAFDGVDSEDDSHQLAPAQQLSSPDQDPAHLLEQSDFQTKNLERLHQAIAGLDPRSQRILETRWLQEEKATLHELAAELGVSAERVRQLEKKAVTQIKKVLSHPSAQQLLPH